MYTVRHEEHTPINPTGFRWMPAAISNPDHGGLGCYVRYKRYEDKPITVEHFSTMRVLFRCPDRDLMVVRDQHHVWPYKPSEGIWDEYVNFSVAFPNATPDTDLQFYMINATEFMANDRAARLRNERSRAPHESFVVADSGGFQLSHGRLDWVDPLELVKWYNANIDLGMVLDIPPWGIENFDDFMLTAKAQAKNTGILMDNKRSDLELINIVHGKGDWAERFHEVVQRDDIDRMAIGGIYSGGLMETLDAVLGTMLKYKDQYRHFHVLGVWNLLQLVPIMRFASKGLIELITSDSSTPIQNANAKRYAYQPSIDEVWQMKDLGLSSDSHPNHHVHLPCRCPVCATLKYTDTLSVLGGALLTHSLAHHNVYQMNNYIKAMYPLTQELSAKDLVALMMAQLGNRRGVHEAKWGIQFADSIADHGFEAARRKLSAYIGVRDVEGGVEAPSTLFDAEAEMMAEEGSEAGVRKVALARRYLSDDPKDKGVHGKKVEQTTKGLVIGAAKSTQRTKGSEGLKAKPKAVDKKEQEKRKADAEAKEVATKAGPRPGVKPPTMKVKRSKK